MNDWYYLLIFIVITVIVAIIEWNHTKAVVYQVMLKAKDLAKDKILSCGKAQEDWVISKLYLVLPKPVLLFLSEDTLRRLVRFLYSKGLDYLDDGKFNNSVK